MIYGISVPRRGRNPLANRRRPQDTWARASAFWRCSIPGDRTCIIIRTSIASFPVAASLPTVHAGLLVAGSFFCPLRCSAGSSAPSLPTTCSRAFHHGKLSFHGQLQPLAQKHNFVDWLNRVARSEWVVYAKPPFGGPQQVLKYLARYTHRVAISNQRLVSLQNDRVTFRWKDYARGKPARHHDPAGDRVHSSLSAARFAPRLRQRSATLASWPTAAGGRISRLCRKLLDGEPRRRGTFIPLTTGLRIKWRPTSAIAVRAAEPDTCGAWKLCCLNPLRPPCSTPPSAAPAK